MKFLDSDARRIDAVYCSDFYKDELELESNGTVSTSYFTDSFGGNNFWICPDTEDFLINKKLGLSAYVVPC